LPIRISLGAALGSLADLSQRSLLLADHLAAISSREWNIERPSRKRSL
jgi:hypothetical protein